MAKRLPFESQHLSRWQMWSLWLAAKATRDELAARSDLTSQEKALLADATRIVDRLAMDDEQPI